MIAINCTHCQQRLEMDEAFAGGVCRCQYCGAIQTVPSHLKNPSPAAAAAAAAVPKAVHPAGGSGTGLDDLAQVVASSGLARSGLRKQGRGGGRMAAAAGEPGDPSSSLTVDYAAPGRQKRSALVPMLAVSALTLVALGVIAFLALSRPAVVVAPPPQPGTGVGTGSGSGASEAEEETLTLPGVPAYADVPLTSNSVVYLIDRSQANTEILDTLKSSIYFSALSLGPRRKFQILTWHHPDDGIIAYPENGLAPATPAEVDNAGKRLADVTGYGNTDLAVTLERAVASNPEAIVVATAKGLFLEDDALAAFDEALKGRSIKVHTFSLGETESPVLKQVAEKTGGRYRELSQGQLKKLKYHLPRPPAR